LKKRLGVTAAVYEQAPSFGKINNSINLTRHFA
jgi:hypothetical protein